MNIVETISTTPLPMDNPNPLLNQPSHLRPEFQKDSTWLANIGAHSLVFFAGTSAQFEQSRVSQYIVDFLNDLGPGLHFGHAQTFKFDDNSTVLVTADADMLPLSIDEHTLQQPEEHLKVYGGRTRTRYALNTLTMTTAHWRQLMSDRWRDIRRFTDRPSAFASQFFEPGPSNMESIHNCPVLVVGAGGWAEILKDLALSGFKTIEVIDMDTIDLSNLNRQFLFREADVGKSKAEVAAAFIEKRVGGCKVIPHNCKIQEKDVEFYRKFSLIICGLDSISARRWLNALVCGLVQFENGVPDHSTMVPMIDGGTEGFKGNSRSFCLSSLLVLNVLWICIRLRSTFLYEKPFEDETLDSDNSAHVEWVYGKAVERASEFGIQGVDPRLTLGVLKRIIPAVASTNAIVAGSCALEALKLASNISTWMDNYLNFADIDGINFSWCSHHLSNPPSSTLKDFLKQVKEKYQLDNPSIQSSDSMLYMISSLMPQMVETSRQNLAKTLTDLGVHENSELVIADESMPKPVTVRINAGVYGQINLPELLRSLQLAPAPSYPRESILHGNCLRPTGIPV
uniref:NEDD8-activating enzyme E1 catalytic subunit n=1 Tax=Ditylenchus dipsaci TaxID=166011 RepID=A0A915DC66_9BILA